MYDPPIQMRTHLSGVAEEGEGEDREDEVDRARGDHRLVDRAGWCRVQGSGLRVQGVGFRVQGLGLQTQRARCDHRLVDRAAASHD